METRKEDRVRLGLQGRVAVVTGGEGGIGRAFVQRCISEEAIPVIWDIGGTQPFGDQVRSIACDVSDPDSVSNAARETLQHYGRVDILVNAAGITGPSLPVADYPLDAWEKVFAVNMTGAFMCTKALLDSMKDQRYGRIVNVASVAGKEGNPNQSAYSASKAALIAFTKSLGKELVDFGILANCVAPTIIKTELLEQIGQAQLDAMLDKIPLGRAGMPEEAAAAIAWLASDECSFSTGAVFDLSGGRATY